MSDGCLRSGESSKVRTKGIAFGTGAWTVVGHDAQAQRRHVKSLIRTCRSLGIPEDDLRTIETPQDLVPLLEGRVVDAHITEQTEAGIRHNAILLPTPRGESPMVSA